MCYHYIEISLNIYHFQLLDNFLPYISKRDLLCTVGDTKRTQQGNVVLTTARKTKREGNFHQRSVTNPNSSIKITRRVFLGE